MKYKKLLIVLTAVTALGIAGCGKSSKETAEVTPTPVPTAAPTAAPATSTPLPTSTPAPKLIGVKTSTAKFVYLTNSTKGEIREIYLRAAGGEEWGKSLVPAEATIKDAEQVQMYYTPDSARDAIYDMKIVDGDGNAYEIYSVQLSDMEKAKLMIDNGEAYLTYTSLSDKSEKSTIGNVETDNSEADSSDSADSTVLPVSRILLLTAAMEAMTTAMMEAMITVMTEAMTAVMTEATTAAMTEATTTAVMMETMTAVMIAATM